MKKHSPEPSPTFVFEEPDEARHCCRCGRDLKYTVPAETTTYLVHADGSCCVIDNEPLVKRG